MMHKIDLIISSTITLFPSLFVAPDMKSLESSQLKIREETFIAQSSSGMSSASQSLENLVTGFQGGDGDLGERSDADELCMISPGVLSNTNEIWNTRPLFLWQGSVDQITVGLPSATRLEQLWSQSLIPTTQSALYLGEELEPGQRYRWLLSQGEDDYPISFRVMEPERRDQITGQVQSIAEHLRASNATAEEVAIEQANYFFSEDLKSDALQVLYSIENPSPSTVQAIQDISDHLCPTPEQS